MILGLVSNRPKLISQSLQSALDMGLNDTSVISEHHNLFLNMHDLELQKLHHNKLAAVPAFWQF
ncbi:hypothetical protein FD24_GL000890 [Lactiplantibacillus pentosus DSM 20314]|uniref:Uncharacterized protein n=1 Tax=Lactiplantibacillus pentosus DSM 20314 TaxID=1423791 RepID=A0A837R803_LACPE|nr:hypothetical protein FD24_GL000890 [Lactiplantibacillus pentosus DSM 20314]